MDLSEKVYSNLPKQKIKICSLNPHIVCLLCAGYLVDATTILECLHTFCKSCIVRYLQSSKLCPTCGTLIHETDPLSHIKLDRTMQDIINKILPDLIAKETQKEKDFLESMRKKELKEKETKEKLKTKVANVECFPPPKQCEQFNICLELDTSGEMYLDEMEVVEIRNKYIRCPSLVKILQLKKLVSRFYDPYCKDFEIKFKCNDIELGDEEPMRYIYLVRWKRKPQPIILYYGFKKRKESNEAIVDDCESKIECSKETSTKKYSSKKERSRTNNTIESSPTEGVSNNIPTTSCESSLSDSQECKSNDKLSNDITKLSHINLTEMKSCTVKLEKLLDNTSNTLSKMSNCNSLKRTGDVIINNNSDNNDDDDGDENQVKNTSDYIRNDNTKRKPQKICIQTKNTYNSFPSTYNDLSTFSDDEDDDLLNNNNNDSIVVNSSKPMLFSSNHNNFLAVT